MLAGTEQADRPNRRGGPDFRRVNAIARPLVTASLQCHGRNNGGGRLLLPNAVVEPPPRMLTAEGVMAGLRVAPVDQHGARRSEPGPAPELRAVQTEDVAEHPQQWGLRVSVVDLDIGAVPR